MCVHLCTHPKATLTISGHSYPESPELYLPAHGNNKEVGCLEECNTSFNFYSLRARKLSQSHYVGIIIPFFLTPLLIKDYIIANGIRAIHILMAVSGVMVLVPLWVWKEANQGKLVVQGATKQRSFLTPEQMLCLHTFSVLRTHSASEPVDSVFPAIIYTLGFFIWRNISLCSSLLPYSKPPTGSFFLFSFSVLDNIEFRAPRWPWTLNPPALTSQVLASLAGATTSGLTLCLPTVLNHQRNPFLLCHHSVLFLRNIMWDSPERAILLGHKMWLFVLILGFTNLISSLLNIFQMTIIKYFTLCIKNTHVVVKARCQTSLSFSIIFKNKFFWVFANMCVYIPCVWLVPSDLLQLPLRIVVSYDMAAKNWIRFSARRATHWLNHLSSSSNLVFETLYFMEPEAHSLG